MSVGPVNSADYFNGLPTAASVSGLSTLLLNSLGELVKTGAIPLLKEKQTLDLNEVTDFMMCFISNQSQNIPANADGMCFISLPFNTSVRYQILLRSGVGGCAYFRVRSTANGWEVWKQFTMTAVS